MVVVAELENGEEPAIRVVSRDSPAAEWRSVQVLLRRWPSRLVFLSLGLVVELFINYVLRQSNPRLALLTFPLVYVAAVGFWIAMWYVGFVNQIGTRYPTPTTVRLCRTYLTSSAFYHVTPDKLIRYDWRNVTEVGEYDGDVFVCSGWFRGCFIPREAFADRASILRFLEVLTRLRDSRGAEWPVGASSGVWAGEAQEPPVPVVTGPSVEDENPYAAPRSEIDPYTIDRGVLLPLLTILVIAAAIGSLLSGLVALMH
jgi:hypothetical protein